VHNPINKVVDHGSNRIDAAETIIKRRLASHRAHFHTSQELSEGGVKLV